MVLVRLRDSFKKPALFSLLTVQTALSHRISACKSTKYFGHIQEIANFPSIPFEFEVVGRTFPVPLLDIFAKAPAKFQKVFILDELRIPIMKKN